MTLHRLEVQGERVTLNVLPPAELAEPLWRRWLDHVTANEGGIAGYDVETTAIDDVLGPFEPDARLRMVQFGSRRYAWCLDPSDPLWRARIVELLNAGTHRFVSHTNYDVLWSHREFGTPIDDRWIDTLQLAALLFPGHTPKGLKPLCDRWLDTGLGEAEAALLARFKELAPTGQRAGDKAPKAWGFTNIALDDPVFAKYAGLDAVYVRRLLDELAGQIKRARMGKLSTREQRISRSMTRVRVRGHRVDGEWASDLLADVEREYGAADERLREVLGFTPRSPRTATWLEERGAEFTQRTPGGRPQLTMPSASSDGTLPQLTERYENDAVLGPVFTDLLVLGMHKNLVTNLRIIVRSAANDGYVHPQITTQSAHTGRMGVSKPAMQTFKKRDPRLRGCFIARDGCVLVGADYDSQEVRIAAAYSRDEVLLKIVRDGLNQHVVTAEMLFAGRYVDKTTVMNAVNGKTYYDAAKTYDFATQYGAGAARLGDQLGYPSRVVIDEDGRTRRIAHPKAYAMWKAWRGVYAGFVSWTEQIGQQNLIVNPWGRRVPADRWRGYANGNYAIQSTGRDVLGDAIVRLEDAGWGHRIWLPVHDELVLEVPEDDADAAIEALVEHMTHKIKDVPLTVSAKVIGTRWGVDD